MTPSPQPGHAFDAHSIANNSARDLSRLRGSSLVDAIAIPKEVELLSRTYFYRYEVLRKAMDVYNADREELMQEEMKDNGLGPDPPLAQVGTITFETDSRVCRFAESCFSCLSIRSIVVPRSVVILSDCCFIDCRIGNITFECGSLLRRLLLVRQGCCDLHPALGRDRR
jgi:hypothetical protein